MPIESASNHEANESIGTFELGHPSLDIRFMDPNRVSEPVTPPASIHSHALYANHHYFNHTKPGNNGAPQFSPSLISREQPAASFGYTPGPSFLASPVEHPLAYAYVNSTQSYLATPHTPKHPASKSQALSSTSVVPRGVGPRNSMSQSSTHSTHSHRHSQSHSQHTTHHAAGNTSANVSPIGHARSYSYNLVDPQASLSRLSISNQQKTTDQLRPRAYSLGISGSLNTSFGSGLDSNSHAFPAPLSSPISPDNLMAGTPVASRLSQRPYSHAFTPSNGEDQFSVSPLYRSLSSASMKAPTTRIKRESSCGSMGSIGFSSLSNNNTVVSNDVAGSSASLTSLNRKSSPPYAARPFHPRRSSSSGSSIELNAAVTGSSASYSGLNNLNKDGSTAATGPQIDLETCTDAEIYALCKDQRGCRFLQRKLVESNVDIVRRIFIATSPHIVTLMVDPFGNYLCQKLFELCNESEILTLLTVASDSLPLIATNQHGTRALQRLIDAMSTAEQVAIIISALDGHVVRLIRDINGNHVIQKLLLTLDDSGSQFIYDAVCESVVEIGSHRHGCCVLQRCLDYAQDSNRQKLVAHIVAQSIVLVCDPFGNYVCQYVIDLGTQEFTDSLVRQLLGKVAALSVQKFSSNVVEKCLRSASVPLQRALVAELMVPGTLNELLLDNYGNYVIQTALESMTSLDVVTKQNISRAICGALTATRSPYGRRIMSKLKSW